MLIICSILVRYGGGELHGEALFIGFYAGCSLLTLWLPIVGQLQRPGGFARKREDREFSAALAALYLSLIVTTTLTLTMIMTLEFTTCALSDKRPKPCLIFQINFQKMKDAIRAIFNHVFLTALAQYLPLLSQLEFQQTWWRMLKSQGAGWTDS